MNPLAKAYWTARGVGWENVPRRLLQAWRMRSGWLMRRLDPGNFTDSAFTSATKVTEDTVRESLQRCFAHFISAVPLVRNWSQTSLDPELREKRLIVPCQKALEGDYPYFGYWCGKIGWPPDFLIDPLHPIRWPNDEHALKTAKSGPPRDDIKLVWEASRFTMAWYFARAYAHTADEKWAGAFWEMFDAWVEQNPPMMSPAWGCGQESTFRMMAMLFAAAVTMNCAAATGNRLIRLAKLVWQTGTLIDANINYALSQKNNHGISEAAGLLTAGKFLGNSVWTDRGDKFLAAEVTRQIYADGSFVQHSMNYHRVMLDDLLWVSVVGRSTGTLCESCLPECAGGKFKQAAGWLAELVDRKSGRVPNYGANDGAQVLPLSCCDYLDYRPVIQATQFHGATSAITRATSATSCHGRRIFDAGPWDEKALWLGFSLDATSATTQASEKSREVVPEVRSLKPEASFAANDGGYYVLRGKKSWCMTRCHTYKDRPGGQDMLHFDLWHDGENVVRDSGSYFYYTTDPAGKFFKSVAAHNTIEIDGRNPMLPGPRFLLFYWYKSKLLRFENISESQSVFEGEHYGYHRLPGRVTHRRRIERDGDLWTVTDHLFAATRGTHDVVSRFRLAPGAWQQTEDAQVVSWQKRCWPEYRHDFAVAWQKEPGFTAELVSGQMDPPEGWESLYYGERNAAPTIVIRGTVTLHDVPFELKYRFYGD